MKTTTPCVLMRAGTSRGPFFLKEWLPEAIEDRDHVLISAIGAGHATQINGLGGGTTLTSKVAIVSKSDRDDCDVDYLFAQVGVAEAVVDTRPNCGNMLAGVGSFAIEQGLVTPAEGETLVRVFNVNTKARIDVIVKTNNGQVIYDGDVAIDGVPGTGAPVYLSFLDAWGAVTGKVFPTGHRVDVIDGIEVTCIDAAMPMVMMRAEAMGLTGTETSADLDTHPGLIERLNEIRLKAGQLMGLGDVTDSVIPKPVLLGKHDDALSIHSRYFTPKKCHTSHAVTGAIGLASAFVLPGTVANKSDIPPGDHVVNICHPSGKIQIALKVKLNEGEIALERASVVRTVRKIMQGDLVIPPKVN
jgi:2-methylaconitate cis-trans-isomerase PrpF